MFWAWTAGIVAGFLLLLLVPVQLEVVYRRVAEEEYLELKLNLPGDWGRWEVAFSPLQDWWPGSSHLRLETLVQGEREEAVLPGEVAGRPARGKRWTFGRIARFIVAGPLGYWLHKLKILKGIWQHFFARVTCRRFRLFLTLGTGEPATTALAYGSSWTLLGWMYQNLRRRARLDFRAPEWQVVPRFDTPGWQADFNCIFILRLGHIISAGVQSLWLLLRIVWQMRGAGAVARTSHRGLDEDRHGKHQGYG
ncbi:hypothetical protein MGLY_31600 [Neomoorella glycerini]|uniref:DUF2953 domain-containing protein n=1 Tax=Neomoorella glycerini TaxID=55779 RepID=A0A6I5ZVY1_9FIRM|nr:DUF2953 domain-containing protein [Moorella glycerini]QGP93738.1 hypothetical protein MGLY_31600 [Moorella glycerini]